MIYSIDNDIQLNYNRRGSGAPLILLHGNGEDHTIFNPLAEKLSSHFTVYAIDSRNHGLSTQTDDYSYEAMAGDIYSFITGNNLNHVSVLGFSDGAIMALMLELAHPGIFHKMVLLGINLSPRDFKPENISYLKQEYETARDPLLKLMLEQPSIELNSLATVKTPTLVVRAEDELFEDKLYTDITNTIPDARLLIMEGHDHGSYVINSDALYNDLIQFL